MRDFWRTEKTKRTRVSPEEATFMFNAVISGMNWKQATEAWRKSYPVRKLSAQLKAELNQ